MKSKKMRGVMPVAALLLALTLPPAAHGQSDGFYYIEDALRDADGGSWDDIDGVGNGISWDDINSFGNGVSWDDINGGGNGAAWNGMDDETPVGGGLLVLMAAGVCYAGAKRMKGKR